MSSFRRNALFAVVGNFSTTAAIAIILVAIARLGNAELVGRFSYALTICAPFFLLAALRLRDMNAAEVSGGFSTRNYLQLTLLSNTVALIAISPCCWIAGLDWQTNLTAFVIGVWRMISAFSDVVYGHQQRENRMYFVAKSQIIHCVATVLAFLVTFAVTIDLPWSLASVCIVNGILLVAMDLKAVATSDRTTEGNLSSASNSRVLHLAMSALPLGFASAIFALSMIVPRSLLERYFSLEEVGIFSALAIFARIGTPVMQSLGQAVTTHLATAVVEGNRKEFLSLMQRAITLPFFAGTILVIAGWIIGQQSMLLIYGPEYVVDKLSIVLTMIYALLIYVATILTYGMIAAKRNKSQLAIMVVTVLAVFASGLILIPTYGVLGACWSLVISAVIRTTITALVIWLIVGSAEPNSLVHSSARAT